MPIACKTLYTNRSFTMQKAFLKVAFISLLSVSSVFAAEGNLLSQATGGAISASKATILSQNEMSEVKGGFNVPIRLNTYPSYLQRLAAYTRVNGQ